MKNLPLSLLSFLGFSLMSAAQTSTVSYPKIEPYSSGYMIVAITPNGEYAAYTNRADEDATDGGRIVNIKTGEVTTVTSTQSSTEFGTIADVTADGNIAVGTFSAKPAYWTKSTKTWTYLPITGANKTGSVSAVTPDGKYAVGDDNLDNEYTAAPRLWDLTTGTAVTLTNLPTKNLSCVSDNQVQFKDISPDGNRIFGVISYSDANNVNYFVYDRTTATTKYIGFDYTVSGTTEKFVAKAANLQRVDFVVASPNCKYLTGQATVVVSDSEYNYAFLYDVDKDQITVYNDNDIDEGYQGFAVDDNGVVYAATNEDQPLRNLSVRCGKYWYSFSDIFSQRYGVDILSKTGLDNTGTPMAVTSDGRYIGTMVNPSDGSGINYTLTEDIAEACKSVDLMANYTFSPSNGSQFSLLNNVVITFDRGVQVVSGKGESVELLDGNGKVIDTSMNISVSGYSATVQFFSTALNVGEVYTVRIPAGTFAMAIDPTVTNKEMSVQYVGRKAGAVTPIEISPEDKSQVTKFDYTSSSVRVTYDAYLKLADENATALVYRNDETEPYETFTLSVTGNKLYAYPNSTVYFYKDSNYRIVIPANVVCDLGGSSSTGNAELTLNYVGGYEREVSSDDTTLFSDDFSDYLANFMLYDGDKLEPSSEMADSDTYNFNATTTPWQYALESASSSDVFAMSHSSYKTAGTSDDWLVTPSIYIPDETCYMQFKGQGFRKNKQDRLNVYVIPSEKSYSSITSTVMEEFKQNRELVFSEVLDPGKTEDGVEGEWTDYEVSLEKFAGKDVYIAFVNENTDQSVVFIDDIKVVHDMRYLVALDNETTVVAQDDIEIYGRIAVQSEVAEYTTAHLELLDANDTLIDTIDETDVKINKNNTYSFRFAKKFPLQIGSEVDLKIKIKLGDDVYTITRTISDVAFSTTKRVVLEEYAGQACGNCPRGILAIDKLKHDLPNNFIAITIRTYSNDVYSSGLSSYSTALGLDAVGAPSAIINRTTIAEPMEKTSEGWTFNAAEGSEPLWSDLVHSELETPAIADINLTATLNAEQKYIEIPLSIKYALNKTNVNASVFYVVVEDSLLADQDNYMYTYNDLNLGEWGAGGKYGSSRVFDIYIDDVARAIMGESLNGTQGYVGSSVVANTEYTTVDKMSIPTYVSNINNARIIAMLIDNNTDRVINANQCKINTNTAVSDVIADTAATVSVDGDNVVVTSADKCTVSVYNISGALIGTANGHGTLVANTNGYTGVAIVSIVSANSNSVKKVVIK
jgi:hypothetical protein